MNPNKAKCTYCTFEYERKDSLDRHVKSYQEVNPLSPTPDFDWVEDVEMEEMHPQNHKCTQCDAEFKEGFNLTKPVNSVHAVTNFHASIMLKFLTD